MEEGRGNKKKTKPLIALKKKSAEFMKNFLQSKKKAYWILGSFLTFTAICLLAFFGLENKIKTSLLGSEEIVSLGLFAEKNQLAIGENFNANLVFNTNNNNVVAVKAVVKYEPRYFELSGWDTANSIFSTGNDCLYEGKPCELSSHDPAGGVFSLTMSKPSPGVNTTSGLFAVLSFKALTEIAPTAENIRVEFLGLGNYEDSDIIADDGKGTDILEVVTNAKVVVFDPQKADQLSDQGVVDGEVAVAEDNYTFETPTLKTKNSDGLKKVELKKNKRFYSKDGKLSFKGTITGLGNGKVELLRDGKTVKNEKIQANNEWRIKYNEKKDGLHEYEMKFYAEGGNSVGSTSVYSIKTDKKKPKITNLPVYLVKSRGEMVWWKAEDKEGIDYFKYEFDGKEKETEKEHFYVPSDIKSGVHSFYLKAYDKAGNKTDKSILIRVR